MSQEHPDVADALRRQKEALIAKSPDAFLSENVKSLQERRDELLVDVNEDYLRQTANQLLQPPAAAAEEFETHRESLAEEHNRRLAQRPDLDKLIGQGNLTMMQDNSRNFCRFMSTMFRGYHPEVLVQTVLWVFRAYRSHGFTTLYWPAHLDTFVQLAQERLSPATFAALEPHFRWLIVNIPVFVKISDEQLAAPLAEPPSHSALPPERG